MSLLPRAKQQVYSDDEASSSSSSSSTESSSIGRPDDDDSEGDDDDAQSSLCLASLQDSLPIKKSGLSNFYAGKSKSFGNIMAEASSLNDLPKSENPFNKRRRLKIAYSNSYSNLSNIIKNNNNNKTTGTSSFYSHSNPISMPLLPLVIEDNDDYDDNDASSQDFFSRPYHHQMGTQAFHHLSRPQLPPINSNSNSNSGVARPNS